jgi:hypothetical protein
MNSSDESKYNCGDLLQSSDCKHSLVYLDLSASRLSPRSKEPARMPGLKELRENLRLSETAERGQYLRLFLTSGGPGRWPG